MSLSAAIIGAGPSGFYAAEALLKAMPECQIDFLDRLPTPFGLVRAGIAPDHQGTKNVMNQYQKILEQDGVNYFGNIELGRDLLLDDLKAIYDLVILAPGANKDRQMKIDGEDLKGVYGSWSFVGWYNAHPDYVHIEPRLDHENLVIIGNGNVSIDIARILAKSAKELQETDIADYASEAITNSPLKNIYVVGRRGAAQASFTTAELRELGKLEHAVPVIKPGHIPSAEAIDGLDRIPAKNVGLLKEYSEQINNNEAALKIHLMFEASPVEIIGHNGHVTAIRFEDNDIIDGSPQGKGQFFEIETHTVIKAIGFETPKIQSVPHDDQLGRIRNEEGWVEDNVYVVGWGKRGPSGKLPANRPEAFAVVKAALAHHSAEEHIESKPGRSALVSTLSERNIHVMNLQDWNILDAFEKSNATHPAPRRKIPTIEQMRSIVKK